MRPLLLSDQEERELQEPGEEKLPAPWQEPGEQRLRVRVQGPAEKIHQAGWGLPKPRSAPTLVTASRSNSRQGHRPWPVPFLIPYSAEPRSPGAERSGRERLGLRLFPDPQHYEGQVSGWGGRDRRVTPRFQADWLSSGPSAGENHRESYETGSNVAAGKGLADSIWGWGGCLCSLRLLPPTTAGLWGQSLSTVDRVLPTGTPRQVSGAYRP